MRTAKKTNKQTTKQTKQNKAKYNMKLPELHVLWRNLVSHVFLLVFFSLLLIFTLVATSVSQFVTNTIKFSCLFLSFAQSIHVRVDIKI